MNIDITYYYSLMLRLTGTARLYNFLYIASELKTQYQPPANLTPEECTCKFKLLLPSCARWTGLALEIITSYYQQS